MKVNMHRLSVSAGFAGSFVDSAHEVIAEILNAMLDAPEVWWCAEHSATGDDARGVCWPGAVFSGSSPCRMVRASIVVQS